MKHKVFRLLTTLDAPDVDKHLLALLPRLDRGRWDVSVGCLEGPGASAARLGDLGMPVRDFRRRAPFAPLALSRVKSHLRELAPDVLHVHLSAAPARAHAAALAAAPRASVATVHSLPRPSGFRPLRAALARADAVIAQGLEAGGHRGHVRELLRAAAAAPGKIHCIPSALDLQAFDRETRATELRRTLGIPREVRLVLSVAPRASAACLKNLVLAARILSHRFPGFVLLLAGLDPRAERRLHRLVAALRLAHTVVVTGLLEDLSAVIREADILLAPSGDESSAHLLLEGMAAGLPTVAARDASVAEIVLDEATGVLYDPDTPDALAASLARLLTAPDLARLMGLAARARVQADFSAQRLALAVQSLYDDLLSIGPESIP